MKQVNERSNELDREGEERENMTSRQFRATEREFNHKVKMRKERPTRED